MKTIWISVRSYLAFTVLLGILYPVAMIGLAKVLFPYESGGSLIEANGKIVGSALIAQKFQSERYFWSRPSAVDYNPLPSGGSNLGPTSENLRKSLEGKDMKQPQDLLFASGSGLDPHISPEAATYQVERIARARRIPAHKIQEVVAQSVQGRELGLLGESRVSVLKLNLALDKIEKE